MTAAVNKRPLTLDEAVGMAAGGAPCAIPVSGDCLEGAGIDNGDYILVDFGRRPRPPVKVNGTWQHDFCLCYGTMPGSSSGDIVMVKRYDGVFGWMQTVSTAYRQEPGRFRMNVSFTPKAILGVVYGCLDGTGRNKWENSPDMYPEQLHAESIIRGGNIDVSSVSRVADEDKADKSGKERAMSASAIPGLTLAGEYPYSKAVRLPLYTMSGETAESWNAKAREIFLKQYQREHGGLPAEPERVYREHCRRLRNAVSGNRV